MAANGRIVKEPPADAGRERESLYRAVLALRGARECERFFRDLCSERELESMASRWRMARELHRGRTYLEVSRITKASTTTVTRAAYWMKHGVGGFRMMLKRMGGKQTKPSRRERNNGAENVV